MKSISKNLSLVHFIIYAMAFSSPLANSLSGSSLEKSDHQGSPAKVPDRSLIQHLKHRVLGQVKNCHLFRVSPPNFIRSWFPVKEQVDHFSTAFSDQLSLKDSGHNPEEFIQLFLR